MKPQGKSQQERSGKDTFIGHITPKEIREIICYNIVVEKEPEATTPPLFSVETFIAIRIFDRRLVYERKTLMKEKYGAYLTEDIQKKFAAFAHDNPAYGMNYDLLAANFADTYRYPLQIVLSYTYAYKNPTNLKRAIAELKSEHRQTTDYIIRGDGAVFYSLAEAANSIGVCAKSVYKAIKERTAAKGFLFEYGKSGPERVMRRQMTHMLDTFLTDDKGNIYYSAANAARALGVSVRKLYYQLGKSDMDIVVDGHSLHRLTEDMAIDYLYATSRKCQFYFGEEYYLKDA